MGEAWEAGHPPKLLSDWQPSLLNSFGIGSNPGQSNLAAMSISNNMVMKNGNFPVNPALKVPQSQIGLVNGPCNWFHPALKVPQSQIGLVNGPCNWFHRLGPSYQAFLPVKGSVYNEKLEALSQGLSKKAVAPISVSGPLQKEFLVIDQSADKTTFVLCSGGSGPLQLLTSWSSQPMAACKFNGEDIETKGDFKHASKLVLSNDFAENQGNGDQSEMQEDTEELDALLYSDDESEFDEDDEVTSTGHSPSDMTCKDHKLRACEDYNQEVASSAGSTKKRKIDGVYDIPSLMDTASSLMNQSFPKYENDAESSCGNEGNIDMHEVDSSPVNKKMKIRETIGILQSLIPGRKGKEAIVVLDEAIQYLTSLRLKAEAFGLNAF